MTEHVAEFSGVKTLLVDLDGTLLGARDLPLAADFVVRAVRAASEIGGKRKAIRALHAVRKALEGKPASEGEKKTNARRAIEAFAQTLELGFDQAENVVVGGVRKIFPKLSHHFFPIDGAKDFLEWAQPHFPLILATNPVWPRDIIEMRLKWAGVDPGIFKRITVAKEMRASKPWVEYYQELLEQESLQAKDCLLVGNDMRNDLAAVQAGIRVFIVGNSRPQIKRINTKCDTPAFRGGFGALREALEKARSV